MCGQFFLDVTDGGYFFQVPVHALVGRNRQQESPFRVARSRLVFFQNQPGNIQEGDVAHIVRFFPGLADPPTSVVSLHDVFSLQVLYIRKGESGKGTEDEDVPYGLQTINVDVFGNNAAKFRFIQKVPVGLGLLEMDIGKWVFTDPLFQNGGLGDFFQILLVFDRSILGTSLLGLDKMFEFGLNS